MQVQRALRDPQLLVIMRNPFRPSWGEPYARIADRGCRRARRGAGRRRRPRGDLRLAPASYLDTAAAPWSGRRLWHDPRGRQCGLASLTSFHFEDEMLTKITYSEPAAHLGPGIGAGHDGAHEAPPQLLSAARAVELLTGCHRRWSQREAGQVVKYEPADRVGRARGQGRAAHGRRYDLAGQQGQGRRHQLLGQLVRAVPGRGRRPGGRPPGPVRRRVRRHQHPRRAGQGRWRSTSDRATYPSIFDPAGRIALEFTEVPPNTIPATLIIDAQGRIAVVIRKAIHRDELKPLVSEVAAEAAA